MNQDSKETEDQLATRLRKMTIRCGDAFAERTLVSFFLDGPKPYPQHLVLDAPSRNSWLTFGELVSMAQSYGDTHPESARYAQTSDLKVIKRRALVMKPIDQSMQVLAVQAEEGDAGSFPIPGPGHYFRYASTAEPAQAERRAP